MTKSVVRIFMALSTNYESLNNCIVLYCVVLLNKNCKSLTRDYGIVNIDSLIKYINKQIDMP